MHAQDEVPDLTTVIGGRLMAREHPSWRRAGSRDQVTTEALLLAGVGASVTFLVVVYVEGALRPG